MKASKVLTVSVSVLAVEFRGAFHFQKIIFLHLLQIWSSYSWYCFHCDTDQLWTHTQSNKKTKCLKRILLTVKNRTPYLRTFWHEVIYMTKCQKVLLKARENTTMLCMARCSSQSTVLSWVSHWPQTPPGRHINITNKACRTLGSGKNPEDGLLFSKRQGLQGSCHTSPGICTLYLAPTQHQPDQLPRVCTAKGSMVDTTEMLQDIQCQQHADNTRLTISPT